MVSRETSHLFTILNAQKKNVILNASCMSDFIFQQYQIPCELCSLFSLICLRIVLNSSSSSRRLMMLNCRLGKISTRPPRSKRIYIKYFDYLPSGSILLLFAASDWFYKQFITIPQKVLTSFVSFAAPNTSWSICPV